VTEVFLQRSFDPPLDDEAVREMAGGSAGCMELHGVRWRGSLLSKDGRRMICRFSAPDAESTRLALRQAGAAPCDPWPGSVHDAPAADAPPPETANVVVERSFPGPVTLDEIQAIEDAGASCLETHRVRFVRTYFSLDRRRMICLYRAPDAEAVRLAQREAGMPLETVWSCHPILP